MPELPHRCPHCGSENVTRPDEDCIRDCMDCGTWFDEGCDAPFPAPGDRLHERVKIVLVLSTAVLAAWAALYLISGGLLP